MRRRINALLHAVMRLGEHLIPPHKHCTDGHLSLRRCKARLSERQAHVIRILHSACHAASRMISPTVGCGKMIFFTCASVMPVSTNTAAVEMNSEA